MTLFDLNHVLVLLGVLGMAILWGVRRLAARRVAARRFATAAMGLLAVLLVMSLSVRVVAPGAPIRPSWLLNWTVNAGGSGSGNAAGAQTTTSFTIEVEHPYCDPFPIGDPIISYTPWAVTITMYSIDTPGVVHCLSQQTPHEGSLPLVGGYLTGIFVPVHLTEPLGGRALFDGSSSPPVARSFR